MFSSAQKSGRSSKDSPNLFIQNVLKLTTGMGASQALIVLTTPLITRLYSAKEFGLWSIFIAIQTILGSIAGFRYEFSIMTADDDEQAANQLGITVLFSLLSSIMIAFAMYFWGNNFVSWFNAPELEKFLYLVPVVVLLAGIGNGLNYWASRAGNFGLIAFARLLSSAAMVSIPLILGFVALATEAALILGALFGSVLLVFVLSIELWRNKKLIKGLQWKKIWSGIVRYKKYPLFDIFAGLLNTLSWQLPSFMFARYFSVNTAGYFSLGMRVIFAPFSLVGTSIAQVLFQQAEQKKRGGELSKLVEEITSNIFLIALCPMLVLMVSGKELFTVIFGSEWSEAGVYAQILSMWVFSVFISSPLHVLLNTLERQEVGLVFNILLLATRILSLVFGGMTGSARIAIGLYAVTGVLSYGIIAIWIMKICGVSLLGFSRQLLRIILWCLLAIVPLIFAKIVWTESLLITSLASIFALASFYFFILIKRPDLRVGLLSILGGYFNREE